MILVLISLREMTVKIISRSEMSTTKSVRESDAMLTDYEQILITAAVDGELTRAQATEFRDLITEQPDALDFYKQLKSDSARMAELTGAKAPVGLVKAVMARLPAPIASPAKSSRIQIRKPSWMPVAFAASLLFTVLSASLWFFSIRDKSAQNQALSDQFPASSKQVPANEPDPNSIVLAKSKPGPYPALQPNKPGPDLDPNKTVIVNNTPSVPEIAPFPRPYENDVFGSTFVDPSKPLIGANLRLPPLLDAGEFAAMDIQAQLLERLSKDPAFRLDLFAKNTATGLDVLLKAARAAGISVTVDAKTQDLINRKQPVNFAFYTEALTPAEVTAFLAELTKQVKAGPKPAALGRSHLIPAEAAEAKDAKDLFGVDMGLLKAPKLSLGNGDPKPISSDTITKVTNQVKKEKPGIVLAYLPAQFRTPASQSKEVKEFLAKKGDRKPGTVAMLFVVR